MTATTKSAWQALSLSIGNILLARRKDPEKATRNAEICEYYRQNPRASDHEMVAKFGVGVSSIQRILSAAGLISKAKRRAVVPYAQLKVVSPLAKAVGAILAEGCDLIAANGTGARATTILGFNEMLLTKMRSGLHNFSLVEIERIAKWMDMTPSQLFRNAEGRNGRG
jgi:hypothetical protein